MWPFFKRRPPLRQKKIAPGNTLKVVRIGSIWARAIPLFPNDQPLHRKQDYWTTLTPTLSSVPRSLGRWHYWLFFQKLIHISSMYEKTSVLCFLPKNEEQTGSTKKRWLTRLKSLSKRCNFSWSLCLKFAAGNVLAELGRRMEQERRKRRKREKDWRVDQVFNQIELLKEQVRY